jgi:hypothetical protein
MNRRRFFGMLMGGVAAAAVVMTLRPILSGHTGRCFGLCGRCFGLCGRYFGLCGRYSGPSGALPPIEKLAADGATPALGSWTVNWYKREDGSLMAFLGNKADTFTYSRPKFREMELALSAGRRPSYSPPLARHWPASLGLVRAAH